MNLHRMLGERAQAGTPVRVGVIGVGKFASMFLSQARRVPGLHVMAAADLDLERARDAFARTGWPSERIDAATAAAARDRGTTWLTEDAEALIRAGGIDVVIEATGVTASGVRHAELAIDNGRHLVMVNVEADALVGPLLARRAAAAGVVYSLAYGDQPALICEQVDWARAIGLDVVAAGKGTKYLPAYHTSTPDTVWEHYGFTAEQVAGGDFNPRMFNSFLDGTKSAIEMAAVANATGLVPQAGGLGFPPASVVELAGVCRPRSAGGVLEHAGTVEVVSSLRRDGTPVEPDLRWGTYVTFEAGSEYVRRCFDEYGLSTDASGRYASLYRPYHLIGLELGISVASVALRGEATGAPQWFLGDVVATAKCDLRPGELLDGEGGHCVYGQLVPAAESVAAGGLPIGLAEGVKVARPVGAGSRLTRADVVLDPDEHVVGVRAELERAFEEADARRLAEHG